MKPYFGLFPNIKNTYTIEKDWIMNIYFKFIYNIQQRNNSIQILKILLDNEITTLIYPNSSRKPGRM